jgi:uncharacterized protein
MRIMVDTNVIISALLKQGSVPDIVFSDVCENHQLILCNQIITECYSVAKRRLTDKLEVLKDLFNKLPYELVVAPRTSKMAIRDANDQPILNAAVNHNVDILITGDRHFLELDLNTIQIITPADYQKKYIDPKG